jgi:hypothetical protein
MSDCLINGQVVFVLNPGDYLTRLSHPDWASSNRSRCLENRGSPKYEVLKL